jgi:AcrR family transcriptional regulator
LLAAAADYVQEHGLGEFSVRACAEAIGTSHRMLLHHFRSKEHLLAAVIAEIRRRQMTDAVTSVSAGSATPTSVGRNLWQSITADAAALRRNLEVVGLALLEPDRYGEITVASIEGYAAGTAAMLEGRVPDELRLPLATAITAAIGGLQIDLMLTGDRARVDAAYAVLERVIAEWTAASGSQ